MKRTNTAQWIESRSRWQINVQKDGIRKTFTSAKPGRAGQREANAKADKWLDEGVEDAKIKVAQASEKFMKNLKMSTSISNWRQYEGYFNNWINPYIGTVRVDSLTEQRLQEVINRAYNKGNLSRKTLSNIRACLNSFIKFCRKSKMTSLFLEDLTIPTEASEGKRIILEPEDLKVLFSEDTTLWRNKPKFDHYIYAYRFQVLTGLRPGELCGLKWSDIKDGSIHIKRSINSYGETTTGKNENARRSFDTNILTTALLNSQKRYLEEAEIESEYVFCNKWGDPTNSRNYRKHWIEYRDYHEIRKSTPYELRHTFVSAVKTLPEGYLKQLVGHSQDMDTYGVYSHQMNTDAANTAAMVQEIFQSILAG